MWDLGYDELYKFSVDHHEEYWDNVAKDVIWSKPYTSVLEDKDSPNPRWYVGGEINMSYNCLDRQVEEGYGDDLAVIHDSAITGTITKLTYKQLLESVELLAGVMVEKCGVVKGDIVLLYFPMIPQGLIAMLATLRIGAILAPVHGGFATKELAARIRFIQPKLILSSNVGLEPGQVINFKERIDTAITMSGFEPKFHIVYNRPNYEKASLKEGRDLDWATEIQKAFPQGCIPVESSHPMVIIFSSGTTGDPKGMVLPTGGCIVMISTTLRHLCGLKPREVWWPMGDYAWILGQSVGTYGSLMTRVVPVIFEGKPVPDTKQFARMMNEHKVVYVLTSPSFMKILRKFCSPSDLELTYSGLRVIYLIGESADPAIREWTFKTFNCLTHSIWGQTETNGGLIYSCLGLNIPKNDDRRKDIARMIPGVRYRIIDRTTGEDVPDGTIGRLILKMPMHPGAIQTIYKDNNKYISTYLTKYPGYYDTMDAVVKTVDGGIDIVAREDDMIMVGMVTLVAGAVEEACLKNEDVADVAVVALVDQMKGFIPFAFLTAKSNKHGSDKDLIAKCVQLVLDNIGEVASFNDAVVVPCIPKTKFGKTPKCTLSDMLNGRPYKIPQTIENSEQFSLIHSILIEAGYKASLPIAS